MTALLSELEKYEDLVLYEDESSEDNNFTVHKGDNCLCFMCGDPGNHLERYPENIRTYAEYILMDENQEKLIKSIHGEDNPVEALRKAFNRKDGYIELERLCKENGIHLRIVLVKDIILYN